MHSPAFVPERPLPVSRQSALMLYQQLLDTREMRIVELAVVAVRLVLSLQQHSQRLDDDQGRHSPQR
jgi:hypothetical protein